MKTTERDALRRMLKARFEAHPKRHRGIEWSQVQARLNGAQSCYASRGSRTALRV